MITAEGLGWRYGERRVLDAVSLATSEGRVLGLVGPNGSGKTTLLRLLHGALRSREGRVRVDGVPLARLGAREAARRTAVVVQEADGDTALRVEEVVLLGRSPHLGLLQRPRAVDHAAADGALARVGAAHLAGRPFAALSGGERQRVLVARALAQEASHLLLDEPTNHLDVRYQHELLSLVAGLEATVVVVLHDLNLAARYCDDVALLHDGGVVACGPVAEVLRPDLLEPVYGVGVERVELGDELHLLFRPLARSGAVA